MDFDRMVEVLQADIQLHVAEMARNRLFVHAGVVGWGERAIVMPGRSFAGKTTLVAALLGAGATYYSDEYAAFDARGRVHPFAKPLALRDESGSRLAEQPGPLPAAVTGQEPVPVSLVALSEYRDGATWTPRALPPGRAVLGMLANTLAARRRPNVAFTTLRQVVAGAEVIQSSRGEAEAAARLLLETADRLSATQQGETLIQRAA